jgi:hypothetical protein
MGKIKKEGQTSFEGGDLHTTCGYSGRHRERGARFSELDQVDI